MFVNNVGATLLSLVVAWIVIEAEDSYAESSPSTTSIGRVSDNLLVLYEFDEGEGDVVYDVSGHGSALDLHIGDANSVEWVYGGLKIKQPVLIKTVRPALKIIDTVSSTGELTIEAWIRPAAEQPSPPGIPPSRIVSLSADPNKRNFTLGQDGNRYDVRLRTTDTSDNGIPTLSSAKGLATDELTHVVYTRDSGGTARIYVNGRPRQSGQIDGNCTNWGRTFPLILANELTGDRPWMGEFYLVAVYGRALTLHEVFQNFAIKPAVDESAISDTKPADEEIPAPDVKPAPVVDAKPKSTVNAEEQRGSAILHVEVPNGAMVTVEGHRTYNRSWNRDRHFVIHGLSRREAQAIRVIVAMRHDKCQCKYDGKKCECGYDVATCCKTVYMRAGDNEFLSFLKRSDDDEIQEEVSVRPNDY